MMNEEVKRLKGIIEDQKIQIALLTEQIEYLTKKLYGTSSEKIKIKEDSFQKQRQLVNKPTRMNMRKRK